MDEKKIQEVDLLLLSLEFNLTVLEDSMRVLRQETESLSDKIEKMVYKYGA